MRCPPPQLHPTLSQRFNSEPRDLCGTWAPQLAFCRSPSGTPADSPLLPLELQLHLTVSPSVLIWSQMATKDCELQGSAKKESGEPRRHPSPSRQGPPGSWPSSGSGQRDTGAALHASRDSAGGRAKLICLPGEVEVPSFMWSLFLPEITQNGSVSPGLCGFHLNHGPKAVRGRGDRSHGGDRTSVGQGGVGAFSWKPHMPTTFRSPLLRCIQCYFWRLR